MYSVSNRFVNQVLCYVYQIEKRISLVSRNKRELMPIHCCAMQGRIDGIQTLLDADIDSQIRQDLEKEQVRLRSDCMLKL